MTRRPVRGARRAAAVLALALAASAGSAASAAAAPDFRGDFETGDLSQFRFIGEEEDGPWCSSCGTRPRVQSGVVDEGRYAAKWILRPDDRRAQLVADSERSWLGSDRFYAASIRFGSDWDWSDQEHETPKNFTILFNLRSSSARGSAFTVVPRSDGHLYLTRHRVLNGDAAERDLGPIPYERWMRFVFRVRLSEGSNGLVEVWRDGRRIVSDGGPTWRGSNGATFKWRIGPYYGPRFRSNRTLWMDDSRVGDSFPDVR